MTLPADIRINPSVPFPSMVRGSAPITVAKNNGIWTLGFSITIFGTQTPAVGSLTTDYLLGYDAAQQVFFKMPLNSILGTTILASTYGVRADNSTDDTAAWARVAAAANATGNITIIVPNGTSIFTSIPPFLANNIWLKAEGAPGTSVLHHSATNALQWGDATHAVQGGGMINVGLIGSAALNSINVVNAARLVFNELEVTSVGTLASLGAASVAAATQVTFNHVHGHCANVASPFIQAINGSGLFVYDPDVYVEGITVPGDILTGREFIAAEVQSWDTIKLHGGLLQEFDHGVLVNAGGVGVTISNIDINGVDIDGCLRGVQAIAAAGGSVFNLHVDNSEITAKAGSGVSIIGAGTHLSHRVTGNVIVACLNHGIDIGSTVQQLVVSHNTIDGVNQAVGAFNGINVAGGASYLTIVSNSIGVSIVVATPGQPATGINFVGVCDHVTCVGNIAIGTSFNYNGFVVGTSTIQAHTNFIQLGNVGLANNLFLGSDFTANGAVATALTSVGPTGSHTTVQEWLTIKNAGGTVRYIPCF